MVYGPPPSFNRFSFLNELKNKLGEGIIMELPNIFKGNYKLLAIPPLILILISLYFIPQIKMGVDFQGGVLVTLTLSESVDAEKLEADLLTEGLEADVRIYQTTGALKAEIEVPQSNNLVMADSLKEEFNTLLPEVSYLEVIALQNGSEMNRYLAKRGELEAVTDKLFDLAQVSRSQYNISGAIEEQKAFNDAYNKVYDNYQKSISEPINKHVKYDSISLQSVSPLLSTHFIEKATQVVAMAAVLSIAFVFLFFRTAVPSAAVLIGALADGIIALGAMGAFGIPLTLPSFAALLMLIGYSLDTDILLTMRMLKRRGDPRDKAHWAMKTGLTMSVTAIIAFSVIFGLSLLTHIPTYFEISAVALAGLVGDMFATWGINAVLLLWHVERRGSR
jgi:preprotein translocase subunit SecF